MKLLRGVGRSDARRLEQEIRGEGGRLARLLQMGLDAAFTMHTRCTLPGFALGGLVSLLCVLL